jgi:hypothetical protein
VRIYFDSRPHLCALLRYDGEAYLLLAELHPRERTERVERRGELCRALVVCTTVSENLGVLVKVDMFCICALKRIVLVDGWGRRVA